MAIRAKPARLRYDGRSFNIRGSQSRVLQTLATFRVVFERDLSIGEYRHRHWQMARDVRALDRQGLVERKEVAADRTGRHVRAVTLTPAGRALVERHASASRFSTDGDRPVHSGWGKPRELAHDAVALPHVPRRGAAHPERGRVGPGGPPRRRTETPPLRSLDEWRDDTRDANRSRLLELAHAEDIPVVDDHLQFPDLRIEYDTASGARTKVDLELTTEHYRGRPGVRQAPGRVHDVRRPRPLPGGDLQRRRRRVRQPRLSLRTALPMNDHARIIALERRGYSRRQAQFLCLVLLHSGCFLRRQYGAFSGIEDGACTTDFVQGLVRRRLATCERFDRYAQLIRLSSGLLYDAIGEPHSRLQRAADPALVTQRLMTLDVLIRYRDHPCLATAEEKRRFFTEVFGVPERDLPSRTYHSPNPGVPPTTRYFVDRIPILLGGDTTSFVYAAGWAPLGHFAQFLNTNTPLMRAIRRARVLFGATDDGLITRAARMCQRRFGQAVVHEPDAATRERVAGPLRGPAPVRVAPIPVVHRAGTRATPARSGALQGRLLRTVVRPVVRGRRTASARAPSRPNERRHPLQRAVRARPVARSVPLRRARQGGRMTRSRRASHRGTGENRIVLGSRRPSRSPARPFAGPSIALGRAVCGRISRICLRPSPPRPGRPKPPARTGEGGSDPLLERCSPLARTVGPAHIRGSLPPSPCQ